MISKKKFVAVVLAALVIGSGSVAALAMAGNSIQAENSVQATPQQTQATTERQATQQHGEVTAENVTADEIVLTNVRIENATLRENETANEAVQRVFFQRAGVSVDEVEITNAADVTIEVEDDTVTVSGTIEEVRLMDVSVEELPLDAHHGMSKEAVMEMTKPVSVETVTVNDLSIERVTAGDAVTIENVTVETLTVDTEAESDDSEDS